VNVFYKDWLSSPDISKSVYDSQVNALLVGKQK